MLYAHANAHAHAHVHTHFSAFVTSLRHAMLNARADADARAQVAGRRTADVKPPVPGQGRPPGRAERDQRQGRRGSRVGVLHANRVPAGIPFSGIP